MRTHIGVCDARTGLGLSAVRTRSTPAPAPGPGPVGFYQRDLTLLHAGAAAVRELLPFMLHRGVVMAFLGELERIAQVTAHPRLPFAAREPVPDRHEGRVARRQDRRKRARERGRTITELQAKQPDPEPLS